MATITSNADGLWSAGGTWIGGVAPTSADTAVINHVVTYDVNTAAGSKTVGNITINAGKTLKHKTDADTALRLNDGAIITIAGNYYIGTEDDPVQPQYVAVCESGATSVSALSTSGTAAKFKAYGSYNYNMAWNSAINGGRYQSHVATNAAAGASTFVLDEDMGLRAGGGDVLALSYLDNTSAASNNSKSEMVTTTAYDSSTKTVTISGTLAYAHNDGCLVINLTRNVQLGSNTTLKFKTNSTAFQEFDIKYVQLYNFDAFGFQFNMVDGYRATSGFCSAYDTAGGTSSRYWRTSEIDVSDFVMFKGGLGYQNNCSTFTRLYSIYATVVIFYHSNSTFDGGEIWNSNTFNSQELSDCKISNMKFIHSDYFLQSAVSMELRNCEFSNSGYLMTGNYGGVNIFDECTFTNVTKLVRAEGKNCIFRNCTLSSADYSDTRSTVARASSASNWYLAVTNSTDEYTIFNNGDVTKVTSATVGNPSGLFDAVPSGATSVARINNLQSVISETVDVRWKFKTSASNGTPKTFTVNAWANGWTTLPTNSNFYLKLTIPGVDDPVVSTESFDANDEWTQFTVSGTPLANGEFTLEIICTAYESGDTIYVDFPTGLNSESYGWIDGLPKQSIGYITESTAAEIADAVWDEATSGHTTAGTFGKLVSKLLTTAKFLGLK